MTTAGVTELYTRLQISWPTTYKQNVSDEWKRSAYKTYFDSFREFTDHEVLEALLKWTSENEKAPSIKALINEAKWLRLRKLGKKADPKTTYQMEWIRDDGTEVLIMHNGKINFTWDEFLNVPRNKDHLDPEEWERRYKIRRTSVLRKCREARKNETTEAAVL